MVDLHHHIAINAPAETVFAAVATQDGMRGWWTRDTILDPKAGGHAEFGFNRRGNVFRMTIVEHAPPHRFRMTCQGDPPDWAGTTLTWQIDPAAEGVMLSFVHAGWRDQTDFCASCNSMWGRLMFRLKEFAETGTPAPQWTE
jgi:uncharacterized protein YndB with AHSA1/START domain